MKAIIFIRSNARKANIEHGHVGWAFEVSSGVYMAGSIEDVDINKRWAIKTSNPQAEFCFGHNNYYPTYDMYKVIDVSHPNIDSALATQSDVMKTEYSFIGKNCMDATYKILKNYGANLPLPFKNWLPTEWFNNIDVRANILMNSKHAIDFSLYEHPNCEGDSERFTSNQNFQANDIHFSGRELGDKISSIVLRKGKLRIFEHQNFDGNYLDLTQAGLYNLRENGFEDKMSSFQGFI